MMHDDKRIASWIANACTHKRGDSPPCDSLASVMARNAARKVPFDVEDIRRLFPAGLALVRNADIVQERCAVIRELLAQGKPIPPELDRRLCDLPGITRID